VALAAFFLQAYNCVGQILSVGWKLGKPVPVGSRTCPGCPPMASVHFSSLKGMYIPLDTKLKVTTIDISKPAFPTCERILDTYKILEQMR